MESMYMLKTRLLVLPLFFICMQACNAQENRVNLNQYSSKQKITTIPFMAENNRLVGAAALFEEGWNGNAWIEYSFYNTTINLKPKIRLTKGNNAFQAELVEWFSYNPQTYFIHEQFQTRESPFVRPPGTFENDVSELVLRPVFSGYTVINQTLTDELSLDRLPENIEMMRIDLENQQQPDIITTVYAYRDLVQHFGITIWNIGYIAIQGPKSNHDHLLSLTKLYANTFQYNPFYQNYINMLNQQGLREQQIGFMRQQNAIMGAYEQTSSILSQMRETSNEASRNHQQAFSDYMLDQTTYSLPNGNEITLPTTDEYTFTNQLGDFISTNNPLFDPNQISYKHNWVKLQQKFN